MDTPTPPTRPETEGVTLIPPAPRLIPAFKRGSAQPDRGTTKDKITTTAKPARKT